MGFRVIRPEDAVWEDRPNQDGQLRQAADVTTAGELTQSRARLWRYPPHTRGRRHEDHGQGSVAGGGGQGRRGALWGQGRRVSHVSGPQRVVPSCYAVCHGRNRTVGTTLMPSRGVPARHITPRFARS